MSEIRPEWMPPRDELLAICHNESLYQTCQFNEAGEDIEDLLLGVYIRAQIAVLEEFRADTASGHARDRMDAKIKELQAQLGEAGR